MSMSSTRSANYGHAAQNFAQGGTTSTGERVGSHASTASPELASVLERRRIISEGGRPRESSANDREGHRPEETPAERSTLPSSRRSVLCAVFDLCDARRSGFLGPAEMKMLACRTGFRGTDAEWQETFASLCHTNGLTPSVGLDLEGFAKVCKYWSTDALRAALSDLMAKHMELRGTDSFRHPASPPVERESGRKSISSGTSSVPSIVAHSLETSKTQQHAGAIASTTSEEVMVVNNISEDAAVDVADLLTDNMDDRSCSKAVSEHTNISLGSRVDKIGDVAPMRKQNSFASSASSSSSALRKHPQPVPSWVKELNATAAELGAKVATEAETIAPSNESPLRHVVLARNAKWDAMQADLDRTWVESYEELSLIGTRLQRHECDP